LALQSTGEVFAVKIMRKANLEVEHVTALREEVTILKRLQHPNVIRWACLVCWGVVVPLGWVGCECVTGLLLHLARRSTP
jgi:hypothetical protein